MDLDERIVLIGKIVKRAENMDLLLFDRFALFLDLISVDADYDLMLENLLSADEFEFTYDIVGIQKNMDRNKKRLNNSFVPRFAGF